MGLFTSKKNPCAICGEATPRIFARRIEDQPLCSGCDSKIDMDSDLQNNLTLQSVKEHFAFLEENKALHESFIISKKFDFGGFFLGQSIIFDMEHRLFCMSGQPDKTIFSGGHLKSFTIKEDHEIIFEGSNAGLMRYPSKVPERVAALAPQLALIKMTEQVASQLDRDGENRNSYRPSMDIPEPFEDFYVELKMEHPYWRTISFKVDGANFNDSDPNANDYLRQYDQKAAQLEELAMYLQAVAFPGSKEMLMEEDNFSQSSRASAPKVDSIEEIRRFKALLEEGIISEEDFAAKKKQLLGI